MFNSEGQLITEGEKQCRRVFKGGSVACKTPRETDRLAVTHRLPTWKKLLNMYSCNTWRYWAALTPMIYAGYHTGSAWVFLGLYVTFFLFTEYMAYFQDMCFYDPHLVMIEHYKMWSMLFEEYATPGHDYGGLLFDGDYTKSPYQAQRDKYDYAIGKLGLKPGMWCLDVGCGVGQWAEYLQKKGINVMCFTDTPTHAAECKSRGLDCDLVNVHTVMDDPYYREKYYGKFDAVTYWECVEHFVASRDAKYRERVDRIYENVFKFGRLALNPKSTVKRIWSANCHDKFPYNHMTSIRQSPWSLISYCLKNPSWWRKWFTLYLNDRTFSGSYPNLERDTLNLGAKKQNCKRVFQRDITFDYYMSTVSCDTHPARVRTQSSKPYEKVFLISMYMVFNPYWLHFYLFNWTEAWHGQFDLLDIDKSILAEIWTMWEYEGDKAGGTPEEKAGAPGYRNLTTAKTCGYKHYEVA